MNDTRSNSTMSIGELPTRTISADAFCEHDGHGVKAATVVLLVRGDPNSPPVDPLTYVVMGADHAYGVRDFDRYTDAIWTQTDPTTIVTLADAVERRDFDGLRVVQREFAPFWCRTCRRSYCREHWILEAVFDPPGRFDYYWGSCPAGHAAMIDH